MPPCDSQQVWRQSYIPADERSTEKWISKWRWQILSNSLSSNVLHWCEAIYFLIWRTKCHFYFVSASSDLRSIIKHDINRNAREKSSRAVDVQIVRGQGEKFLAMPTGVKLRTSGHWVGTPDKSWCHRHTSVKLSCLQAMDPWAWAAAHSYAVANVHGAIGCNQKSFPLVCQWHQVPTQRPLVPSFVSVVG